MQTIPASKRFRICKVVTAAVSPNAARGMDMPLRLVGCAIVTCEFFFETLATNKIRTPLFSLVPVIAYGIPSIEGVINTVFGIQLIEAPTIWSPTPYALKTRISNLKWISTAEQNGKTCDHTATGRGRSQTNAANDHA